jgi:hypothetical protein
LSEKIQFTCNSHSCCVCFVDVVDSTRITTVEITNVETSHISAFKDVLEYGLTMIAVNPIISANLHEELLPSLHYRISTDYGRVEFAKSLASTTEDLFGSTLSICSKINSKAAPNGVYL